MLLPVNLRCDEILIAIGAEFVNTQFVPAWKPIVQEVKEEHDLHNATNPGLNVRVARHVDLAGHFSDEQHESSQCPDLLVDPIECIEYSVAPEHDNIKAGAPQGGRKTLTFRFLESMIRGFFLSP